MYSSRQHKATRTSQFQVGVSLAVGVCCLAIAVAIARLGTISCSIIFMYLSTLIVSTLIEPWQDYSEREKETKESNKAANNNVPPRSITIT